MSFEVAALHTTIGVKLDGVQDALRFSRQIEEAQKAIGVAAGNSSAQVQKLTNDLQAAVTKLQSFSAEPAKIAAEAQALGTSIQSLSADLAKATSAADQQQARLDELKKTYDYLHAQLYDLESQ